MTARRETLLGVLLGILAIAAAAALIVAGEAHASPPPPNAAPRLDYRYQDVARGAARWSEVVFDHDPADGLAWVLDKSTCDRVAPLRYRCVVVGRIYYDDAPMFRIVAHLTRGRSNRNIRYHQLSSTRARVVVKSSGRKAGGVVFRARIEQTEA